MKNFSIICAFVLAGLLWLVFTEADREGFVLLTDETFQAEIIAADQNGILSPEEIVTDEAGNVYLTDKAANELWTIKQNGKAERIAGGAEGIGSTEGIAIAPDGRILVGDSVNQQILSVSKNGAVSVFIGAEHGIEKPESLAFDEAGNLFIADNKQNILYLLDTGGELRKLIEADEKFSPESIRYANGSLYITDNKNGKLSSFNLREGLKTIAVFGGNLQNLQGITIDKNGGIYVSVQSKNGQGFLIKLTKNSM